MDLQTKTCRLLDVYPDLAREYAQKLHRKKEDLSFIQKFYASDKADDIRAERAVVSYISTAAIDRDNEVLLPKGMRAERYEKSGKPVFWGHSYGEPRDVIGQCQWLKIDGTTDRIVAKTAFRNNEFSEEIYQLYTEDLTGQGPILRGWSVGFIPLEWEEGKKAGDPRRTFTEWELLEFSAVSIPCNPDAQTILSQKGIKLCDRLKKDLEIDVVPEAKAEHVVTVNPPGESAEFVQVGDVNITEGKTITNVPDDAPFAVANLEPAAEPEPKRKTLEEYRKEFQALPIEEQRARVLAAKGAWLRNPDEPEPPVAKMFDTEQNPSVADIWGAIDAALNPPTEAFLPTTYKCLWDIYPVAYPSGHAVYGQRNTDDTANEGFMIDYSFEKGVATIGEKATPVAAGYVRRRGGKDFDGKFDLVRLHNSLATFETKFEELRGMAELAIANLQEIPVKLEADTPACEPPALDIEPSPDVEIEEPAKPAEVIDIDKPDHVIELQDSGTAKAIPIPVADPRADLVALFKSIDWKSELREVIALEIDKARGVVR